MGRKVNNTLKTPLEKIRDRFRYYRSEIEVLKKNIEERKARHYQLQSFVAMATAKCSCGRLLRIMSWGEEGDRFILTCDNIRCQKYRQPAGTFKKSALNIKN